MRHQNHLVGVRDGAGWAMGQKESGLGLGREGGSPIKLSINPLGGLYLSPRTQRGDYDSVLRARMRMCVCAYMGLCGYVDWKGEEWDTYVD